MPELIIAVHDYAGWLYVLLALLGVRELLVLARSGREHDAALFGLEREAVTGRALRALITLFLLSTIGLGIYLVSEVLAPALPAQFAQALAGARRVLVVEQNHSAQFHRYLRSVYDLPGEVRSYCHAGPLPIRPSEVLNAITEWSRA